MSFLLYSHVLVSMAAIAAGFSLSVHLAGGKAPDRWVHAFMITTAYTVLSSFAFPISDITPALVLALTSLAIMIPAFVSRYVFRMAGKWSLVFLVSALSLFYVNCLVLIVQAFQKVPSLNAMAPTGGELPATGAQVALFVAFLTLGVFCFRGRRCFVA